MTKPGGNGNVDIGVGVVRVVTRQDPDRQPTGGPGAARRVLHDAGQAATDQDGLTLRNAAADLEGQLRK